MLCKGKIVQFKGKDQRRKHVLWRSHHCRSLIKQRFVHFQKRLTSQETLEGKEEYERYCLDNGVLSQKYLTDTGSAFTSNDFTKHLLELKQEIRFTGVGAHHQNAPAECHIGIIMKMARTMMIHVAIHWPAMADPVLLPMAVNHATYLFNHLPDETTGFSPHDKFSRTRWYLSKLHDMHVWGCPVYVLDGNLADGKKIPR